MVFEYKCRACGDVLERDFPVGKADSEAVCECGGTAKRYYNSMSFILKGGGWPGKKIKFNKEQTDKNRRAGERMLKVHEPPPKLIDQR